ncbi:MAG: alpha amylase C-terminal domain-containing protein, partial [Clostridia bacterium]|nr:alpha amylase C-terminal domain-containing protein [Clostridia bacterium]
FEWLVSDDYLQNILVYERRDENENRMVAIINFSPVPHSGYRFGAHAGEYTELLRTEIYKWDQSGKKYKTEEIASHGKDDSLCIDVPPMGGILLYCPNTGKKAKAKNVAEPQKATTAAKPTAKPASTDKKVAVKKPAAEPATSKAAAASTAKPATSGKAKTASTAKKPAATTAKPAAKKPAAANKTGRSEK